LARSKARPAAVVLAFRRLSIWARDALVSARLAALLSVRRAKSSDACALSSDPTLMEPALVLTDPMRSRNASSARLKFVFSSAYSGPNSASRRGHDTQTGHADEDILLERVGPQARR
jgi:hypothetical protein